MKTKSELFAIARIAVLLVPTMFGFGFEKASAEPWTYIEPEYGPRFYLGDEDTRAGRAHFLHGDYGLAEAHYRRAVEATPFNSAAWIGLAASYDRLKRFDLADRAYRRAAQLHAKKHVLLNNRGYSYLLRGDFRRARRDIYRAHEIAPLDLTIANNIAVMESGQGYFWSVNW